MKKIFVADQDEKFQTVMKSLCRKANVDLHIYNSSMEILPLIEQENPDMVFMNLDLPDINDFVMFDLLKKADTKPPIPVLITYSTQSEKELQNYRNLKFQPQGYHKKPFKDKDIQALLSVYLGDVSAAEEKKNLEEMNGGADQEDTLVEEDDNMFNEIMTDNGLEDNPLESLDDEEDHGKPIEAIFKVSDGNSVDIGERTGERERAARLVSLEKQNYFLRNENKQLQNEIGTLKKKPLQLENELKNKYDESKSALNQLAKQVEELTVKLTDKERELVAKDHEFEKRLKKEADGIIRETEERLRSDIRKVYQDELSAQKELNAKLQHELAELKEMEISFNASISGKAQLSQKLSELENEKKSIMKRLMSSEDDLANLKKEKEEIDKSLSSQIEKSSRDLESAREELKDYRNRIGMLGELLQKAVTLTRG
ncbi:MAG: response regulator [Candidatus Aminicenantes bacterium]|nr:response regulator [Candidatus Aminicenantes bacterium]